MAFGSVGSLGTGTSVSSGTSLAFSPAAQLDAGNIGILIISLDNESTTDGNTSEVSSVVDSVGNTYSKLREFCNGNGAANAGATVSVWFTKATTNLTTGGTVTVTLANTKTVKAATFWEFTIGGGNTLQVATSGAADLARDATTPGSLALAGLANKEYLFIRGIGTEHRTDVVTATANHTKFTDAPADGGSAAASQTASGEWRILTGTGNTSNPSATTTSDRATTLLALEEIAAGGGFQAAWARNANTIMGAGSVN